MLQVVSGGHPREVNKAGVVYDIKGLDAVEGHAWQLKALHPEEGFATRDCQQDGGLNLSLVSRRGEDLEPLDRVAMSWQNLGLNQTRHAVESTEVYLGLRLLQ